MEEIVRAIEKISEKSIVDYFIIVVPIVISVCAIIVSVATARRQNKIAMFELRHRALATLKRISNFSSVFYVTSDSQVVIEAFNCCFATSIDSNDQLKALSNSRMKINDMEENVAIISDMLSELDKNTVEKTFVGLSKIITDAICNGYIKDKDVQKFKFLCVCLEKITTEKLSQRILGSSWCFNYTDPGELKNSFSIDNPETESIDNDEKK